MENKTIKTTMNKVMITGKLVKNGLEEKQTKKNVEAIMGSLIVRTSDGSEHEISLFTNKYKKDDSEKKKTVYIEATCIFGGVEVK